MVLVDQKEPKNVPQGSEQVSTSQSILVDKEGHNLATQQIKGGSQIKKDEDVEKVGTVDALKP